MTKEGPIVFFDGVCGLCDTSVDFFMRKDRSGILRFAPLQGETAARLLPESDRENLNSMVYFENGERFRKSAAVVRILRQLGGIWALLGSLLWVIPRPLRDLGYSLVAAVRYRVFGKKSACRVPTSEERGRLLT